MQPNVSVRKSTSSSCYEKYPFAARRPIAPVTNSNYSINEIVTAPCVASALDFEYVNVNHVKGGKEQRNQLIEEVEALGAETLFIPQYEPRANAIEGGFSQMNKFLEDDLALAERDPERAIHEALLRVDMRYGTAFARRSREDVRKWL